MAASSRSLSLNGLLNAELEPIDRDRTSCIFSGGAVAIFRRCDRALGDAGTS